MSLVRALTRAAEPKPLWAEAARALSSSGHKDLPPRTGVAIIGAGYTGLWTALYLKTLDPAIEVLVLDEHQVGHGASGRNGGWCSALLPTSLGNIASTHGSQTAVNMREEAINNLYEMKTTLEELSIDCDYKLGGTLTVARNDIQHRRLLETHAEAVRYGATAEDLSVCSESLSMSRIHVNAAQAALFTPHCAALHPRKLVDGLAKACTNLGVSIHDRTKVDHFGTGTVHVTQHDQSSVIECEWVVRATEGYTARFGDSRRELLPLYSFMIATEPLSEEVWSDIGWEGRETLNDARNGVVYAQRTEDGRIVFGGRGAPYHFASRIKDDYDVDIQVHESLVDSLHDFFPATQDVSITHRWGGPLGVPRDWRNFARVDHERRIALGGGYSGDGVALSHLTGRMLAYGILRRDHASLSLPWFGHVGPRWEVEPLRWLGVNSLRLLVESIDAKEARHNRSARLRSAVIAKFLE